MACLFAVLCYQSFTQISWTVLRERLEHAQRRVAIVADYPLIHLHHSLNNVSLDLPESVELLLDNLNAIPRLIHEPLPLLDLGHAFYPAATAGAAFSEELHHDVCAGDGFFFDVAPDDFDAFPSAVDCVELFVENSAWSAQFAVAI